MKKFLLSLSAFAVFSGFAQDCSAPFISEYSEGYGNNKALEIYNPTSAPINLSSYFLLRMNNGTTIVKPAGTVESNCVQLPNVMLAPYDAFVIVLDRTTGTDSDPAVWDELLALADVRLSSSYEENNTMNFNGNDAVILALGNAASPSNAQFTDIFGRPNNNPAVTSVTPQLNGWSSVYPYNNSARMNGDLNDRVVTQDHVMVRKPGIKKGISNYLNAMNTPFNPLLEWDSFPARVPKLDEFGNIVYQTNNPTVPQWDGNWSTLGWHICDCNPEMGAFEGSLDAIEMYPNPTTGSVTLANIEAVNAIEVRNALGQLVYSEKNEGKNIVTIDINDKAGVYFVTIKDKAGKSATRKLIVK